MGYYIEVPKRYNKAQQIKELYGAEILPFAPAVFPLDRAVICVVENYHFDAAAFCYSESEFKEFSIPDGRKKIWLLMDLEKAKELTGYKG